MKKQVILLSTMIVFVLLLCGAVSAADSQRDVEIEQLPINDLNIETTQYSSVNSTQIVDPEITLNVTLEHPEALSGDKLPTVTVNDTNGNSINGITVTKTGNNQYKVNFISAKSSFNLTVSALGHVPQTVNVSVSQRDPTDPVLYGDATVNLRAYNLMIITGSGSYSKSFVESYKQLKNQGYYYNLYYFGSSELNSDNQEINQRTIEAASKADIIVMEMIGSSSIAKINNLIQYTSAQKILLVRSDAALNDPRFDSDDTITRQYFDHGAQENIRRFQLYVLNSVGMKLKDGEDLSIVQWPKNWIYHPDAPVAMFETWDDYFNWYQNQTLYQKNGSWIGIVTYDSNFKGDNHEMHVALLRSLESKGFNVILTFANAQGRINIIDQYFKNGNTTRIDALITSVGFNYVTGITEGVKIFEDLNIPVFTPVYTSNLEEWLETSYGLISELHSIALPELDGRIEPILMGGKETAEIDEETGISVTRYKPIPERIERITERVKNWVELRKLDNFDKQIALLYYNIGGGKDGVSASYLDVVQSVESILKALKDDGYNIPVDYSAEDIVNLMLTAGNNVGSWAPGELEKVVAAGAITIPINEYLKWFQNLPESLQAEVLAEWGPAPGNVMIYQDQIVIPGIMIGNVFLGPQPMRGWGEDPEKIKHSTTLPPHHQYIAFYMWMQNQFNAVIHLGTHGTLEWLPGRSVGLGDDDWPDVLLGNLPNIYPYIVENPGEGTQAKRRSYAVIIDHMIPPMIPSGLYGELSNLNELISSFYTSIDPQREEVLKSQIIELIKKLYIHEDLNLDLENTPFDEIAHEVEHYLEDLADSMMPYGLHIFGVGLSDELLNQMIESIVSFDPKNRDNTTFRDELRQNLIENMEIQNLLAALRGEFISPASSGSPIRKPDILPTGMNFYSFDSRSAPDTAAWELGKKMADDLIESFYNEKGYYPESIGVILWSIETMRTNGQSVAMILRLMGAEPSWSSGRWTGIKVTPLSELNRPRVDVVVSISGLFRDTFSYTIGMFDDAFRLIAALDESNADNYVRKHYLEDLEQFLDQGLSQEEAENIAIARIFGPAPEAYGTGLNELATTTTGWEDQSDLVDTYLRRMSYYYGRNSFAVNGLDSFKNQLRRIDATVQVRDGLFGILDNDDVVQYLGGLTMAAQSLSGKDVSIYIANSRTLNTRIESLYVFLNNELRTRVFNPKWAEGLLQNGFSGANAISSHIENLFIWNAISPESIDDRMWQQVAETFVFNSNMRNQLIQANPYAFASATGWMLEAARRGMWNPDSATLTQLIDHYIQTTNKYGVTCCHHTCANVELNKFLVSGSSLSLDQLQQFADAFEGATGKTLGITGTPAEDGGQNTNPNQGSTSTSGNPEPVSPGETSTVQAATTEAGQTSDSNSQNVHEVTEVSNQNLGQSATPLVAILGVILLMCLVGVGYFRNDIRNLIKK